MSLPDVIEYTERRIEQENPPFSPSKHDIVPRTASLQVTYKAALEKLLKKKPKI